MAKTTKKSNGEQLGFEAKLWLTADKLRNNMDAAEYKHVLGFSVDQKFKTNKLKGVILQYIMGTNRK